MCVSAHIAHTHTHTGVPVRGPVGFLDITSPTLPPQQQARPGIPVTSFHGQDSHFHYSGAGGGAQPFLSSLPLLVSSSSPCQSSQCCHSGSVSEISCLWAKIQTHLRDGGRLLTQTHLSWSCTSISLPFSASWHFSLSFYFFFPTSSFPRFFFSSLLI